MLYRDDSLAIARDEHGVPQITAADDAAMIRGLGFCHALDRGMQMLIMRVLGRGELSKLDGSDASLEVDLFFRRTGWAHELAADVAAIDPATRTLIEAYCAGVNARFAKKLPWELRVAGYRHTPWQLEDCVVVARVISYMSGTEGNGLPLPDSLRATVDARLGRLNEMSRMFLGLAAWLGRSWLLAAAPLFVLAGVLYFIAQPLVIQPLFNRFHPLDDQRLTREIKELGAKEGVTVDKVLVADASRRTTTANAYVSGLGPTKRVVFYDTMLDGRFSPPELESVAAHELGHVAKSHIWKGLGWFALIAIPGVFLVWWLTERRGGLPDPRLVPLAIAVALVYSLLVAPFGNLVSRRYEAEADWMALTATNDPESFIDLERKLTVTSLGDPDPPAWSNLFFGTHPTAMKRIGMAVAFRNLASPVPAGS